MTYKVNDTTDLSNFPPIVTASENYGLLGLRSVHLDQALYDTP